MSRRRANSHKLVKGCWKHKIPGNPSHTSSGKARSYFVYPPATGWPGGDPKKNGAR